MINYWISCFSTVIMAGFVSLALQKSDTYLLFLNCPSVWEQKLSICRWQYLDFHGRDSRAPLPRCCVYLQLCSEYNRNSSCSPLRNKTVTKDFASFPFLSFTFRDELSFQAWKSQDCADVHFLCPRWLALFYPTFVPPLSFLHLESRTVSWVFGEGWARK